MYNIGQTIISQYFNSPTLSALIASMNEWIDPAINLENFYNQVWNIQTAQGFGLNDWGEILGVSRYVELPAVGQYVGFYNSEGDYLPMSQGPLYAGGADEDAFALTDAVYRTLLLAKALANISTCSIQALNVLVQAVFGAGAMYVVDLGGMAMVYLFASTPSPVQSAIANNSGILPRPTGVAVSSLTALLSNAVMVAATSGSDIGYANDSIGHFGTLTPAIDGNGHTVGAMFSTASETELRIASASSLGASYINYLIIGSGVLAASAASYSYSGSDSVWVWTSPFIPLTSGTTYNVLLM